MSALPMSPDDPRTRPHWEGAKRGVLLLQRCDTCGHHAFPATTQCVKCHQQGATWVEASGSGTVSSYCTFHKAYWPELKASTPYTVVQIELDEGVSFISNIVDTTGSNKPRIGMRVKAYFDKVSADQTLVRFIPA
ncbi:Zn-ribbon domain-containing OB-fold protein [Pseudomonas aeruginosa]|uniref:Zn-ribbon domain-containing OB-fold protein n=1 Tax=Pseudomonas aeruginosa TaxID=287 RepID=UPI000E2E337A|nr:OB-fold domain-containing protein [Pseudomonas aeruginosa]MDC3991898.1 OB-fold domain-containing protein [Pseudomonas aeruginosa]WCV06900.1 OB-fold domain-containing protein [Pseudomonas aeruginosa]SVK36115.1 Predicted nucleic-acid-binding protein containing a Zn-ribbon [Acinetobacter baumannii]